MIEILHPGVATSLQDAGRLGWAHLGVGGAGAADLPALTLANLLVGNAAGACAIEMTLHGPTLRIAHDLCVAVTGADLPHARLGDKPLPKWRPVRAAAGTTIALGGMPRGCRSYLAVSGGFNVPTLLGSRATDLNAGIGGFDGRCLRRGDRLPTGIGRVVSTPRWSLDPEPWFSTASPIVLRLLGGRHRTALDPAAVRTLVQQDFRVDPDSNRVGVRLAGPQLRLSRPIEMVSEGNVAGVVQLPPDGHPIILGCEHPVTGGYPRIAQLAAADLPHLAQLRPGDVVRFRWIEMADALQALHRQRRMLAILDAAITLRLRENT